MPTIDESLAARGIAVRGYGSLTEVLLREGDPFSVSGFAINSGVAAGTQAGAGIVAAQTAALPIVAKAVWIDQITFSASHACLVNLQIDGDAAGRFTQLNHQMVVGPGNPVTFPVGLLVRGFQVANGVITVRIRNNLSGATADIATSAAVTGWQIADDFDLSARNAILWAGDSTSAGTGYTSTAASHMAQTRDYLRGAGTTARLILKARSGSTTSDHEKWRRGGWYDVSRADIGFYDIGINDAGGGVAAGDKATPGTYIYNLNAFWQWWKTRYPGKRLVVLGCSPLENDTKEAVAATYRTAAAAFVASEASALLIYINLGAAFDRKGGTAFYTASDTAGDRVHRNDAGEAAIAAAIIAGLTAQSITLS